MNQSEVDQIVFLTEMKPTYSLHSVEIKRNNLINVLISDTIFYEQSKQVTINITWQVLGDLWVYRSLEIRYTLWCVIVRTITQVLLNRAQIINYPTVLNQLSL